MSIQVYGCRQVALEVDDFEKRSNCKEDNFQ